MKIKREKLAGLLIMVVSVLVLVGAFYYATKKEEPANAAGGRYSKADLANMKEWYYSQAEAPAGCKTLVASIHHNTGRGFAQTLSSFYVDTAQTHNLVATGDLGDYVYPTRFLVYVTSDGFFHTWWNPTIETMPIGSEVTIYWR